MVFLRERIAGIDELAALLLVQADASTAWTARAVAAHLQRPESWAGPALEGLCAAELLEGVGSEAERRFTYRPATPALASAVSVLAAIYEEHRADILRLLNEDAVERIRAAAARTFTGSLDGRKHERAGKRKDGGE